MQQIRLVFSAKFWLAAFWSCALLSLLLVIFPAPGMARTLSSLPLGLPQQAALLLLLMLPLFVFQQRKQQHLRQQLADQQAQHQEAIKHLKQQYQDNDSRYQTLMQNDQLAYWEWQVRDNRAYFSPQWGNMLGLNVKSIEPTMRTLQNRIHPKDQPSVQKQLLKILSGDRNHFECTHRVQHQDGHYIWVHDKGQIFYNADGDIVKLSAIRLDISEQKWIEEELEVDSAMIEHAFDGMGILDDKLQLLRVNRALSASLGIDRETLCGMPLSQLLTHFEHDKTDEIIQTLNEQTQWRGELVHTSADGTLVSAHIIAIQKVFHDTTQRTHYCLIQTDITDLKRTQKALDDLANFDRVTGLANRNKLYRELEAWIENQQPLTLLFMDLDNFKTINDTLGHDMGDKLLKAAAEDLRQLAPSQSLVSRIGGDEFVICYPWQLESQQRQASNETETETDSDKAFERHHEEARHLAERISQKLKQPYQIEGQTLQIGSSIGIAFCPQDAATRKALLKQADQAMYLAKREEKGGVRFASELLPESPTLNHPLF